MATRRSVTSMSGARYVICVDKAKSGRVASRPVPEHSSDPPDADDRRQDEQRQQEKDEELLHGGASHGRSRRARQALRRLQRKAPRRIAGGAPSLAAACAAYL